METIKISEICGHLPYGLEGIAKFLPDTIFIVDGLVRTRVKGYTKFGNNVPLACMLNEFKPLLLPLSSLTDEQLTILDSCHDFSIMSFSEIKTNPLRYPYTIVQKLLEWHFDIHGLIERGIGIDKTTITT